MPIKKQTKTKRQNRPSEVRLSGVPPISLYKKKSKYTLRNMFIRSPPYKAYIKKKRQNTPSEIRLSGVPPIMPIKTHTKNTKGKKNPHKYVLQGSLL